MDFIINILWYTIPFVFVLSILIFVHEFGHFITARICKVKVEEFSIGFGKKLFGKTDKFGTLWKICAVPFGGYVKMFGDEDASSKSDSEKIKKMSKKELAQTLQGRPLYQRFLVIFAGPFFNYIFAIICFTVLFVAYGQPYTSSVVSEVVEGSPAQMADLQPQDKIIKINNTKIEKFENIQLYTSINLDKELEIVFVRDGVEKTTILTPKIEAKNGQKVGMIGIVSKEFETKKYNNVFLATAQSFKVSNDIITGTLKALGQIVTGKRSGKEMGGPLKIAQLSKEFAVLGVASLLYFIAILSVNLALINLFPIPVLDGGHLLFILIESIIRKPVSEKIETICFKIGAALLIALAIMVTFNDILGFFK